MLKPKDYTYLEKKGISIGTFEKQLENFKSGFPFANIIKPGIIADGVVKLSEKNIEKYISEYAENGKNLKKVKFVPASGAASRMFKELFELMQTNNTIENIETNNKFANSAHFFSNIQNFAFYNELKTLAKENNINIKKDYKKTLELFLTTKGLNYGNLPKGLLKFHKYETEIRTAAEEHFAEALNYAVSENKINIHFTVSPEHRQLFEKHFSEIKTKYKQKHNIDLEIEISEQKSSTDTIAVDMNNEPLRDKNNKLIFRPAGHGALIQNLNEIEADIIFVKNIDNIVPDKYKEDTYTYKKALGGLLINIQNKIHKYLSILEENIDEIKLTEIEKFVEENLYKAIDITEKSIEERTEYLFKILNRPIRICGMVKNEGEPGGGPFFVKSDNNEISLQIVESAQIDLEDSTKREIVSKATHFNPVDLILSVKNYKGDKFDLTKFIDQDTFFISQKSKDGIDLKALELPGLWNGAMAFWNTIFVEIPISTFNPVKTINDLLREMHQ